MTRKEEIRQKSEELFPDSFYSSMAQRAGFEPQDRSEKRKLFIQAAEWADENPSEANIAMYLGKKGCPLSTNGIQTYEEASKSLDKYYEYKKKQWIDRACNWLREHLVFEEENNWCTDLQDNPPSNKEKMIDDFCKTMSNE